ncbi:hypothetical protein [Aquidulcibacter sp.]|jgi:hypothetical protein|uniref:hypothetical protein n=1 Tax=Aquidulcibacter sp. TaxID=2052990 RepID=UPI003BA6268D
MRGLDLFQARFAAFGDSYALIGGAACHLIFEDLGLAFRATKDLDIVLCAQVVDAGFAQALWAFIQDGGYEIRQRADGKPTYYRFAKPANADFPYMLEIFARPPATLDLVPNQTIIPVPIEDGQYSLSAILLDEDYFGLLRGMIRRIDGVSVLDEYALIPFKAKAWMELSDRRDAGEDIDSRTIVKHLRDVFRLMAVLVPGRRLILPEQIRNDIADFCDRISRQAGINPSDFGLAMNLQDAATLLEELYSIRA